MEGKIREPLPFPKVARYMPMDCRSRALTFHLRPSGCQPLRGFSGRCSSLIRYCSSGTSLRSRDNFIETDWMARLGEHSALTAANWALTRRPQGCSGRAGRGWRVRCIAAPRNHLFPSQTSMFMRLFEEPAMPRDKLYGDCTGNLHRFIRVLRGLQRAGKGTKRQMRPLYRGDL